MGQDRSKGNGQPSEEKLMDSYRIRVASAWDGVAAAAYAGCRSFELMATLPGVPLYEKLGYKNTESVQVDLPNGRKLRCRRMVKFFA